MNEANNHPPVSSDRLHVRHLMQQGQIREAACACERLCGEQPTDAEAHYLLGTLYGQLEKFPEAATAFRTSIALQPAASVVHHGLGMALVMLGQLPEAEQAFRETLALQPNQPDVLFHLASLLISRGKLTEAEDCLQHVLGIQPDSVEALHRLALMRQNNEQFYDAIHYYKRALEFAPNRVDFNTCIGHCLYHLGKVHEALRYYNRALAIDAGFLEACMGMGKALVLAGEPERARGAFRKALRIRPDYLPAILQEINLSEQEGDFAAAFERLSPLIRQGIENPALAVSFLRLCSHFERCDEAIDYAERLLEQALEPQMERLLQFTLGALFDRLGEFDRAFSHFQRGNALNRDTFSAAEHAAVIDALIRVFSWRFFTAAPRASLRSDRPVFIVGMPRSGTSLTEQILASHAAVHGAGELTIVGDWVLELPSLVGPEPIYPFNFTRLTTGILDQLARRYFDRLAELGPAATRVTDKMPQNFLHLGLIAMTFPEARVIHCTRDPRDTCLSIYFQNFAAGHRYAFNLEHLGLYYRQYEKLMQHFRGLLGIPLLEVRYEDLVTQQEATSRKLIDFVGLEWDDRCLAFNDTARFVATSSYSQVRKPMYPSSVGRWKHYEKHLGPLLAALEAN